MIEVEGLSKHFGEVKAVDGITFKVGDGEIVGFLGPNGAGKTTTMKVITCFHSPTGGRVKVNGYDVEGDPVAVRKSIGYLPENNPLYHDMGVLDYLSFIAGIRGIDPSKRKARLDEIVEVTSLGSMAHKDIGQLSRGFRQRVGLAQALIHDPPVLILDEPTSGLDPIQIQEIRTLIRNIGRQKTVIFSTHILPEAQSVSDRILIISDGKLAGEGTPEELSAMAAGDAITHVSVKGDGERAKELLEAAAAGARIEPVQGGGGAASFRITGGGEDVCERIFDAFSGSGLKVVELYREKASLEDVFNRLTRRIQHGGIEGEA
ncbi:MAG: ATP-binding cassette domain-containing protein [bacterium]|jgi:ABC-2 type transport system ATP-binding protein